MTADRRCFPRDRRSRRGSLYIQVMVVATIVSMMALCAIHVVRLDRRHADARQDVEEAKLLARSAVELATNWINTNPNWRTTIINNIETPMSVVGNGTFSWLLYDEDGDLADSDADPVLLKGIGRVGNTVQVESVLLNPAGSGQTCLEAAAHAGSDMTFASAADVTGSGIISANNNMIASGSPNLNLPMQAVNGFSGSCGPGSTTSGITPRQMPDPGSVFDYYISKGTVIHVNDLPKWAGEPALQYGLLSPANNSFGAGQTNPQGIYIIDLQGAVLWIRGCRIVGTLVLLNASRVEVYSEVNWEPAVANFPAMLVDGKVVFQIDSATTFSEGSVNLNPPGTPYEGVADSDTSDSYPIIIKGLVYTASDFKVAWGKTEIEGAIVANTKIDVVADLDVTYRDIFLTNPPPGFSAGTLMQISPGSWRRATP